MAYAGFAQEITQISIVYLQDGSMIKGQVVEDHALDKVTIKIIDGTELSVSAKTVKTIIRLNENVALLKNGKYVQAKGLYKYINTGILIGWADDEQEEVDLGANLFHMVVGYQFNSFISVGGGVGLDVYDIEYIPVYADFRGYILNSDVSPFYAFQVGYGISANFSNSLSESVESSGGLMIHPSVGIRFASFRKTKLTLEAGYKFQYDKRQNSWWIDSVDKIIFRRLSLKLGFLF